MALSTSTSNMTNSLCLQERALGDPLTHTAPSGPGAKAHAALQRGHMAERSWGGAPEAATFCGLWSFRHRLRPGPICESPTLHPKAAVHTAKRASDPHCAKSKNHLNGESLSVFLRKGYVILKTISRILNLEPGPVLGPPLPFQPQGEGGVCYHHLGPVGIF